MPFRALLVGKPDAEALRSSTEATAPPPDWSRPFFAEAERPSRWVSRSPARARARSCGPSCGSTGKPRRPPAGRKGPRVRARGGVPAGPARIAIPDRFVGGATETSRLSPTMGKNGKVVAFDLLPDDHDAEMVTSITATDQFVLAAGVVHRTEVPAAAIPLAFSTWASRRPPGISSPRLRRGVHAADSRPPTSGRRPPSRPGALPKPVVWIGHLASSPVPLQSPRGPLPRAWLSSGRFLLERLGCDDYLERPSQPANGRGNPLH